MSDIRSDVVEEALRIANRAKQEGFALRLLGGIAIRLRATNGLPPVFRREYADSHCKRWYELPEEGAGGAR